jgi:hypothetical protein
VSTPPFVLSAPSQRVARIARPPAEAPAPRVVVPVERHHVTRERLGRALAALATAAFALAALASRADFGAGHAPALWAEAIVALARGVVLGAVVGVTHRHRRGRSWAAVGAAVTAATVTAIVLVPSPTWEQERAWLHTVGLAALSAVACARASVVGARVARGASASAALSRLLVADYPLVGLVGLITPALWLLAAQAVDLAGVAAAACLALFGGSLLASVRASRGPAARGGAPATAAAVAVWTATSAAPLIALEPAATLALIGVMTLVAGTTAHWLGPTMHDRRFERRALVRGAPALAGALVLGTLAPNAADARFADPLDLVAAWPTLDGALGAYAGLALVAGYAAAELRSRAEEPAPILWRRIAPWVALGAAVAEGTRAALGAGAPTVWRGLLAFAAARLGAALFSAHRDHVRALLAAGRTRPAVSDGTARWAGDRRG